MTAVFVLAGFFAFLWLITSHFDYPAVESLAIAFGDRQAVRIVLPTRNKSDHSKSPAEAGLSGY
jgi:hypothetical protein